MKEGLELLPGDIPRANHVLLGRSLEGTICMALCDSEDKVIATASWSVEIATTLAFTLTQLIGTVLDEEDAAESGAASAKAN